MVRQFLPTYDSYRPTLDLDLPGIPKHWNTGRLRLFAFLNPSRSESQAQIRADDVATFLPMEAVSGSGEISATDQRPSSELSDGFTYFRRNDVLLAKITPCFENGKGASLHNLPTEIGFGSTEFIVLRPKSGIDGRYLYLLTATPRFRQSGADSMTGAVGQQRVPVDFVRNYVIPVPPLDEQEGIVEFAKHIDHQFSRLIRNKRRLIALLNEEKQAIIQQAVTRGLDPDVPMKPSGVEWLDEIPAHWEVASLGGISRLIQTGPFGSQLHASDYVENAVQVINPSHLNNGRIAPDSAVTISEANAHRLNRHRLRVGDLIAARRGELGRCAVVTPRERDWLCGTGSLIIRPRADLLHHEYLQLAFSSKGIVEALGLSAVGSTMSNLSAGLVARQRIPVPPVSEQMAIVKFVWTERRNVDKAIDRITQEIDLIREYRTRLIADVVTGQLDVREAAASLPEIEPQEFDSTLTDEADGIQESEDFDDETFALSENADAAD